MSNEDIEEMTFDEHLDFWCLTEDYLLPDTDRLIQDVRRVVQTNHEINAALQQKGFAACPIWENHHGSTIVRATTLPDPFLKVYYENATGQLLEPSMGKLVAAMLPLFFANIAQATLSFDDTLKLWIAPEARTKLIEVPYEGHFMLLSTILLDFARKYGAGLTLPEYLMSIGLYERFYDGKPGLSADAVEASMNEKLEALWDQEDTWLEEGGF